ncbi:MAG TPA: GNAT family N-acetyltransferase [Clostridia bacterium]|nr:MAG: putative acetyltransferase [Firmicutes bacterium ADurb.Bin146]HQM39176.1 GNAT family N-acetyltransferase [Clostridia bacterium]
MDYMILKISPDTFSMIKILREYKEEDDYVERLKRIDKGIDECYAVIINNECVADLTVTYKSEDKAATIENYRAYLSGLFVKEDYRNKKIATLLMSHLIKELSKKGFKELSALVDNSNVAAYSFYNLLGFQYERTYRIDEWVFELMVYHINDTNQSHGIFNSY